MRCEILWACFVRAKITVQAEFCPRHRRGGFPPRTKRSRIVSTTRSLRFLIDGNIGRQLAIREAVYADARFWCDGVEQENGQGLR